MRNTVSFFRNNPCVAGGLGLDLIRCESLQTLETETCNRLLTKNYELLVSMAPLTNEIRPVTSCHPPHLGPAVPEVSSVWFKLYLYALTGSGPPTLLLAKGTRLRVLPRVFQGHERLMITTWGHDPGTVPVASALPTLNDALCHSAVLIQGQGNGGDLRHVPFPLAKDAESISDEQHPTVHDLARHLDLEHSCGYVTLMRLHPAPPSSLPEDDDLLESTFIRVASGESDSDWNLLDCSFGIPLFDATLNRQVCQRVVDSALCQGQSLLNLVESSRKLSTELLQFIQDKQEARTNPDGKSFVFPPSTTEGELPYPTVNLLFVDGVLSTWDGT